MKILTTLILIGAFISCTNNQKENNETEDIKHENVTVETPTSNEDEMVVDMHTAQISIDWVGTYKGVLPCADCEGIETVVTLNQDQSFEIQQTYLGKSDNNVFTDEGSFKWNEKGNSVILSNQNNQMYKVGENKIIHLDEDGQKITGDLASKYILRKL